MTRIAQVLNRAGIATAILTLNLLGVSADARAKLAEFRVEQVSFTSGGERLRGDLYIPAGVTPANPGTAVVVTGAWMTIKEQMPARYAKELASRGIVALAFDFRGWGESGGQLRAMEDPKAKTEDIRAAVSFLSSRSDVNPRTISGLGICASAGYMAEAAATMPALRSIALVAPWLHDRAIVNAVYGGKASVQSLIEVARKARSDFESTGKQTLVPASSTTDKTAVMFNVPYYTERERGLIPQWENTFNLASWEPWLTFNAMRSASRLKAPLLMVHSDSAAIPQGARQFYAAVTAPKRQLWLDNVTQFDFYDREAPVTRAADAVAQHFRSSLSQTVPNSTHGSSK